MKGKCICPVCGKEFNTLLRHIHTHNSDIHNKEDFYKAFPDYDGALHIDVRKKKDCTCELCGKTYDYNNSLILHYKNEHFDYYNDVYKKDKRKNAMLVCPICGKNYADMKQHVEGKHLIAWDEFCNTYNWNIKLTKYISEEYRKNLSENKTNFYRNTERGAELKHLNSEIWKTEKNPSKNRKSMKKAMYSRATGNKWIPVYNYRGIKVQYKDMTFRSFTEFQFYILCLHFNKPIKYEPHEFVVQYYNEEKMFLTSYLPDFFVDDQVIELKSAPHEVCMANKAEKYIKIKNVYRSKHIKFIISSIEEALSLIGIPCEKYQVKDITRDVIREAIENDEIHVICKPCSRIIKYYFELDDLSNNKNITLI